MTLLYKSRKLIIMSTGTDFAKMVRTAAHINSRTRDHRDGSSIKADILEAIRNGNFYPGYYSEERSSLYRAAFPTLNAWTKHVQGYRIDPVLIGRLNALNPWEFAGLLGAMIDAGISNNYEAEMYFSQMRATP